jgi:hypothetical protein
MKDKKKHFSATLEILASSDFSSSNLSMSFFVSCRERIPETMVLQPTAWSHKCAG